MSLKLYCCTAISVVVIACSGTGETTPPAATTSDGSALACSNGARWPAGTSFEWEMNPPTEAETVACVPHCSPNEPAGSRPGYLRTDALPYGACTFSGTCEMEAEWLGVCPPGVKGSGPVNRYLCRCVSGAWACTKDGTAPSGTIWSCPGESDAGAK